MTTVSMAEYARRVGVSRAALSQWKTAGRLVLEGNKVDVEATDARLKRYRRAGLPDVADAVEGVKRGRPSVKQDSKSVKHANQLNKISNARICLTNSEIAARLAVVDWSDSFDWSEEGQEARARRACEMLGWEMVIADRVDDGHWSGFQVRITEYMGNGLHEGAVAGGFGFELYPVDVLRLARDHVTGWDREDTFNGTQTEPIEIPEAIIGLLAYPFFEYQQRPQ